jgi:peroxiredoxin
MRILILLLLLGADGEKAPDFTLPGLDGKPVTLSAAAGKRATVLLFLGIECPRSVAAEPRLNDFWKKYGEQGAAFLVVNSNRHESVAEIADHAKKAGFGIPHLKDEKGKVADLFKVEIQPTAILLDGSLALRYRGLIDDHKVEELVRNHHLRDALEAVLAGKEPALKSTEPVGCTLKKGDVSSTSTEVTYAKHVAPILNRACVNCHRPGQVGPFALDSYEQAQAWSAEIVKYAVKKKTMPPWKPVTNPDFYWNERRLAPEELAVLEAWHRNGAPPGDAKDLPPPPKLDQGWMLGTPDLTLKAEGGWEVAARGRDEYRCYVLKNTLDRDVWVQGVEYRPGNLKAIHHIIGYLDQAGLSEKRDAADPAPGYKSNGSGPMILPSGSLAGWAPGNMPRMLPDGSARLLRKGERIVLETHYHRTGRPEKDEGTEVGLYFAKAPVKKKVDVHMIAQFLLRIPPGAAEHKVAATFTVPVDTLAYDVMPHMHLIGRSMSVRATFPDGTTKDLVVIDDWDFAWQETYQFKQPLPLPKGTKIRVEAVYDNSERNPNNPSNPPKPVRWGEQTTDEMCIAFIHYTRDDEDRTKEK